jgi:hypothetical protein
LIAGGLIAMALQKDPAAEVITPERFSSIRMPAISVAASPPWRLVYDVNTGRLFAHRRDAKLMIETSFITDADGAVTVLNKLFASTRRWARTGASPFGSRSTACGRARSGSSAALRGIWVIERRQAVHGHVCTSRGSRCQTACDGVLST